MPRKKSDSKPAGPKPTKAKSRKPKAKPAEVEKVDYAEYIPESFHALTDAQKVFVITFLRSGDLRESWEAANPQTLGEVTKTPDGITIVPLHTSSARMGWMWYQDSKIRDVIEAVLRKMREHEAMDALEIRAELARIARAKPTDVASWNAFGVRLHDSSDISPAAAGAIKEIRTTKDGVSFKMYDRRAALVDLAKIEGVYKDDKDADDILLDVIRALAKKRREGRVDAEFTEED